MLGASFRKFPSEPSLATLTRTVLALRRSKTNTSGQVPGVVYAVPYATHVSVSSGTRLGSVLTKATKRPSADSSGPASRARTGPMSVRVTARIVVSGAVAASGD